MTDKEKLDFYQKMADANWDMHIKSDNYWQVIKDMNLPIHLHEWLFQKFVDYANLEHESSNALGLAIREIIELRNENDDLKIILSTVNTISESTSDNEDK